jgi:hypothetical protein
MFADRETREHVSTNLAEEPFEILERVKSYPGVLIPFLQNNVKLAMGVKRAFKKIIPLQTQWQQP